MKRIASVDVGGTNTHCIVMKNKELISKAIIPDNKIRSAKKCFKRILQQANLTHKNLDGVALTGGGSRKLKANDLGANFTRIDEIKAIAKGGMYLSGKKNVFIVNIGTGTAMVAVEKGDITHPGGSGLGGGTIQGFAKRFLHVSVAELENLANRGKRENVDLTVGEIIGNDLGKIPADATASNLAKLTRTSNKKDIAAGFLNMVAESLGVLAYFAARTYSLEKEILICGQVAINRYLQSRIKEVIAMMGGVSSIPQYAEYCTAIGAALTTDQ